MSEWFPQIVRIEKIEKHQDADSLDIVTVLGDYPVVVKHGTYKVGDLAGYLPLDTILPDKEEFYFLCPRTYEKYEEDGEIKQRAIGNKYELGFVPEKYRTIRAKKIRGIYSMGMLVNVPSVGSKEIFTPGESIIDMWTPPLKKMEEVEEDNIPNAKRSKGANAAPSPKGWAIPYYDIESVRKNLSLVENEQDIVLTEKLHGSNAGFCHDGNGLVVKSRNFYKSRNEDDMWWEVAIRYDLENKLSKYPMLVFFGELVGNNKGFRYNVEVVDGKLHTKLYFFDIWDTKSMRYLDYDQFVSIISELGLETTPLIYRGPWKSKKEMYSMAEKQTALGGKHIAEGWVLSLGKEKYEPKLNGRLKLKYISEQYNLSK